MDLQNLAYALLQIVHNFGAVAVTGGSLAALAALRAGSAPPRWLGGIVLMGWAVQIASGAGFGAVSYAYYGAFPDIHGIAIAALGVKLVCAASGVIVAAAYVGYASRWSAASRRRAWIGLAAFAATALSAAAFLRWFS
ncbi:MAG: hypothetical protein WAZ34_00440 [Rhodocyclaceae bacterium]